MEDVARLREMQATYEAMRQRYQMLLQLQQLLADLPGEMVASPDGRGVRIAVRDERELEALMIRRALLQSIMEAEQNSQPKGPPPVSVADLDKLGSRALTKPAGDCVVCMEDMGMGTVVCELPCGHMFCRHCVHSWLKQHRTCPVCRFEVDFGGPSADTRRKVDPRTNRVPNTMPTLPGEAGIDSPRLPRPAPAPVPTRIPFELRRLPTPMAASERQRDAAAQSQRIAAVASNGHGVSLLDDDSDDEVGMVYHPPPHMAQQVPRASGGAARAARQLREAPQVPATEPPQQPAPRRLYETEDARPSAPRAQPEPPREAARQPRPQPRPVEEVVEDRDQVQLRILRERRARSQAPAQPSTSASSPVASTRPRRDASQPQSQRIAAAVARSTGSLPASNSNTAQGSRPGTREQSVLSQSRQLPTASLRSGMARRSSSTSSRAPAPPRR